MLRDTLQLGDPRLKQKNQKVTNFESPKVKQVVADLVDTMRAMGLIGMAAPQIGENWQIFVTEPRETKSRSGDQTDILRIFINSKITEVSEDSVTIYEGCGCVAEAKLFGPVVRPREITIEACDENGSRFSLRSDGILGRVLQHESDHLSGIEFVERVIDHGKLLSLDNYVANFKNSLEQTEASVITVKEYKKL